MAALTSPFYSYAEPVRISDDNAYIYYESRAEIQAHKKRSLEYNLTSKQATISPIGIQRVETSILSDRLQHSNKPINPT